jgi:hypothetical protein
MTNNYKSNYFLFHFVILIMTLNLSCSKHDEVLHFVDISLQEYFDRFVAEASIRSLEVDFNRTQVNGYIRLITEPNVVGQCAHREDEPNTVIIDKLYWDQADDLEREFLVFHELGHCVLNRNHLDDADVHGVCLSIMASGGPTCRVHYTQANRNEMLQELFTP